MSHALIIDDNVILSRAIRSRLEAFGFDSFDYTWAEQQALEAAAARSPDLIVVGDTIADGSPLGVAGHLAASGDVPVLVVTTQSFMLQRRAPEGERIDGPYRLSELDQVLAGFQDGCLNRTDSPSSGPSRTRQRATALMITDLR